MNTSEMLIHLARNLLFLDSDNLGCNLLSDYGSEKHREILEYLKDQGVLEFVTVIPVQAISRYEPNQVPHRVYRIK